MTLFTNLLKLVNQRSIPNAMEMHLTIPTFGYITTNDDYFTIALNRKTN